MGEEAYPSAGQIFSVTSAEQIPGDFEAFKRRASLKRTQGKAGEVTVYLTRYPYTAEELDTLIQVAWQVRDEVGTLQRLVQPFVTQPILSAVLFYVYQQARAERSSGTPQSFYTQLQALHAPIHKERRPSPVAQADTDSDLWDLLDAVKSLR